MFLPSTRALRDFSLWRSISDSSHIGSFERIDTRSAVSLRVQSLHLLRCPSAIWR